MLQFVLKLTIKYGLLKQEIIKKKIQIFTDGN